MQISVYSLAAVVALVLAAKPLHASGSVPNEYTCTFKMGATVTYAKGQYKSAKVMPLSFRISDVDLERQSASLEAGAGKSSMRVVRAINANHFLEVVTEGFLNTTTIYDRDPRTASYPAVHSRHFGLFGEPVVAQYYGFCKGPS